MFIMTMLARSCNVVDKRAHNETADNDADCKVRHTVLWLRPQI